jgi:hypothetical protein
MSPDLRRLLRLAKGTSEDVDDEEASLPVEKDDADD